MPETFRKIRQPERNC